MGGFAWEGRESQETCDGAQAGNRALPTGSLTDVFRFGHKRENPVGSIPRKMHVNLEKAGGVPLPCQMPQTPTPKKVHSD